MNKKKVKYELKQKRKCIKLTQTQQGIHFNCRINNSLTCVMDNILDLFNSYFAVLFDIYVLLLCWDDIDCNCDSISADINAMKLRPECLICAYYSIKTKKIQFHRTACGQPMIKVKSFFSSKKPQSEARMRFFFAIHFHAVFQCLFTALRIFSELSTKKKKPIQQ